jgi:hypothetical protein
MDEPDPIEVDVPIVVAQASRACERMAMEIQHPRLPLHKNMVLEREINAHLVICADMLRDMAKTIKLLRAQNRDMESMIDASSGTTALCRRIRERKYVLKRKQEGEVHAQKRV